LSRLSPKLRLSTGRSTIATPASRRRETACLPFFFQAEDGIRDATVTGVQTCALPILHAGATARYDVGRIQRSALARFFTPLAREIGRASCRERGEIWAVAASRKRESGGRAGARGWQARRAGRGRASLRRARGAAEA